MPLPTDGEGLDMLRSMHDPDDLDRFNLMMCDHTRMLIFHARTSRTYTYHILAAHQRVLLLHYPLVVYPISVSTHRTLVICLIFMLV
jgi:hypothetical protein